MNRIPKCLCWWRFLELGCRKRDLHDGRKEGPIEEDVVVFAGLKVGFVETSCSFHP